MMTEL